MENRILICQFPDKENAEFYKEREERSLLSEGLYIEESSVSEINNKWVVRIMAKTPQGEFDFDN